MCYQVQLCTFLGNGDIGVGLGSKYSLSDPFLTP